MNCKSEVSAHNSCSGGATPIGETFGSVGSVSDVEGGVSITPRTRNI
jgi:hypothetical protein